MFKRGASILHIFEFLLQLNNHKMKLIKLTQLQIFLAKKRHSILDMVKLLIVFGTLCTINMVILTQFQLQKYTCNVK